MAHTVQVSVIIAVYNCADTIERAVESALIQGDGVEVIVIDDCSTDDTFVKLEHLSSTSNRVRALRLDRNQGPSAARNRGLNEATGKWVTPLDADDFMMPNRLGKLIEFADLHDLTMAADNMMRVMEHDLDKTPVLLWPTLPEGIVDLEQFVAGNLRVEGKGRQELGFMKPLINRQFLVDNQLNYKSAMRLGEDYIFYVETLLNGGSLAFADFAGYMAVVRETSLSGQHATSDLKELLDAEIGILKSFQMSPSQRQSLSTHKKQILDEWAWRNLIDAVKERDALKAASCFFLSFSTSAKLTGHLLEQVIIRLARRLSPNRS